MRYIFLLLALFFSLVLSATKAPKSAKFVKTPDKAIREKVYIRTDMPFYSSGDEIGVSVFVLAADGERIISQTGILEVFKPDGQLLKKEELQIRYGIAKTRIRLPDVGGVYKLRFNSTYREYLCKDCWTTKEIQVQDVRMTDVNLQLTATQSAYRKGDTVLVKGTLSASAVYLPNYLLKIKLYGDGLVLQTLETRPDGDGKVQFKVRLPDTLNLASAFLNVSGIHLDQTFSKYVNIPLASKEVNLVFLPEGGQLLAGIQSRIALKAFDALGNATALSGKLFNAKGQMLAEIKTIHNGMGSFELEAEVGDQYKFIPDDPDTRSGSVVMPKVLTQGQALKLLSSDQKQVVLRLESTPHFKGSLCLQRAEREIRSEALDFKGQKTLMFTMDDMPTGVYELVLKDTQSMKVAGRLFFHRSRMKLNIDVEMPERIFSDSLFLVKLRFSDETGKGIKSSFAMSLFNEKMAQYADPYRENIVSAMLLQEDLKDKVDKSSWYFESDDAEHMAMLDLLMLCSGWRGAFWESITASEEMRRKTAKYVSTGYYIEGKLDLENDGNWRWRRYRQESEEIKHLRQTELICLNNQQKIKMDLNGKFRIVGIPDAGPIRLRVKYGLFYREDFTVSPRLSPRQSFVDVNTTIYKQDIIDTFSGLGHVWDSLNRNYQERHSMPVDLGLGDNDPQSRAGLSGIDNLIGMVSGVPGTASHITGRGSRIDATAYYIDAVRSLNSLASVSLVSRYIFRGEAMITDRLNQYDDLGYRASVNFFSANIYHDTDISDYRWGVPQEILKTNGHLISDENGTFNLEVYAQRKEGFYLLDLDAFSERGDLIHVTKKIRLDKGLSISYNVPVMLREGDRLKVPVRVSNNTAKSDTLKIFRNGYSGNALSSYILAAGETKVLEFEITDLNRDEYRSRYFKLGKFEEYLNLDYYVSRLYEQKKGSFVFLNEKSQRELNPNDSVLNNELYDVRIRSLFFDPEMLEAMSERMVQEPHGCFEQLSSVNYANSVVRRLLKNYNFKSSWLTVKQLENYMLSACEKMSQYEVKSGGFDWYGKGEGHEGLSAYGLLQFKDMQEQGIEVDTGMINRTLTWLLSRVNEDGSFKVNKGKYGFSGVDKDVSSVYVTWVLSRFRYIDLRRQILYAEQVSKHSDNLYLKLLLCGIYQQNGRLKEARLLLQEVLKQIKASVYSDLQAETIFRSGGAARDAEILGMTAVLCDELGEDSLELKNIRFSLLQHYNFSFGSTQANVWALKAYMGMFAPERNLSNEPIQLFQNDSALIQNDWERISNQVAHLNAISLKYGPNRFRINFPVQEGYSGFMSFYYKSFFHPHRSRRLDLRLKFSADTIVLGEQMLMTAEIVNRIDSVIGQTLAVFKAPAGFDWEPENLKELIDKGYCDYYEIRDERLILYYRELGPKEIKKVPLVLRAVFAGVCSMPQAYTYLYYNAEEVSYENIYSFYILNKHEKH